MHSIFLIERKILSDEAGWRKPPAKIHEVGSVWEGQWDQEDNTALVREVNPNEQWVKVWERGWCSCLHFMGVCCQQCASLLSIANQTSWRWKLSSCSESTSGTWGPQDLAIKKFNCKSAYTNKSSQTEGHWYRKQKLTEVQRTDNCFLEIHELRLHSPFP